MVKSKKKLEGGKMSVLVRRNWYEFAFPTSPLRFAGSRKSALPIPPPQKAPINAGSPLSLKRYPRRYLWALLACSERNTHKIPALK